MELSRDKSAGQLVRSYSPGSLQVGEQRFTSSVIITVTADLREWSPPPLRQLSLADLSSALRHEPQIVLLGTGGTQHFPSPRLVADILRQGIGFEAMTTDAACRTYNVLVSEGRRVAAALMV